MFLPHPLLSSPAPPKQNSGERCPHVAFLLKLAFIHSINTAGCRGDKIMEKTDLPVPYRKHDSFDIDSKALNKTVIDMEEKIIQ